MIDGGLKNNFKHKTIETRELIQSKTLSGATSVTFDGLNGDIDGTYILVIDNIQVSAGGADRTFHLKPNNLVTDLFCLMANWYDVTGNVLNFTNGRVFQSGWSSDGQIDGEILIKAKTGKKRIMKGNTSFASNTFGKVQDTKFNQIWSNTSVNLTSLVLDISGGTFSGTLRLYKVYDKIV